MRAAVGHRSWFVLLSYGSIIRFRPHRINYHTKCIFAQCFISIASQNEKAKPLQPGNRVLGGVYVWILGTWDIGALNTLFLVIKCDILYLNGNIMFHFNVLAKHMLHVLAKHMLHTSFAYLRYCSWRPPPPPPPPFHTPPPPPPPPPPRSRSTRIYCISR